MMVCTHALREGRFCPACFSGQIVVPSKKIRPQIFRNTLLAFFITPLICFNGFVMYRLCGDLIAGPWFPRENQLIVGNLWTHILLPRAVVKMTIYIRTIFSA